MLAIKGIKLCVIRGAVLGAKPPAPIAPFSGQERFVRLVDGGFRGRTGPALLVRFNSPGVDLAGIPEKFPSGDVFAVADPDVEIGVNPRSRKNPRGRGDFSRGRDGLCDGKRTEIGVRFDAAIKLAQKFAAISGVVFPSVFAIEEQTDS